jgi:hypothetical protein
LPPLPSPRRQPRIRLQQRQKAAFVPNENLKGSTQTDGKLVKKVSKDDAKAVAQADKEAKATAKAESKGDVKAK